jgi:hypothetical protein
MTEQTKNIVILPDDVEWGRWCSRLMNDSSLSREDRHIKYISTEFIIDAEKYQEILDKQHSDACDEVGTLVHPARKKYGDLSLVISGITSVQKMVNAIEKAGTEYSVLKSPDNEEIQKRYYNNYVGDFFEVFAEFLIKSNSQNHRVGIIGYKPVNTSNGGEDYGVDGYGVGLNGRPATVQIKFRSKMMEHTLTANEDHLVNFKNDSHETYKVNNDDVHNMLIISTAGKVHHKTRDRMLNGKVRFLLLSHLETMTRGVAFWNEFRRLLAK